MKLPIVNSNLISEMQIIINEAVMLKPEVDTSQSVLTLMAFLQNNKELRGLKCFPKTWYVPKTKDTTKCK